MEGDQVAQQVNTGQWDHCMHYCIISLHEVLKCLEKMKFNSDYIIQIKIINNFFYPLSKSVFKVRRNCKFPKRSRVRTVS